MKVLLAADGELMNSTMSECLVRARYLILFDIETGEYQVWDNTKNMDSESETGIQRADLASRLKADYVIAGHCGEKAFQRLQGYGIQVILGADGTVAEALEKFKAGKLLPSVVPSLQQIMVLV